MLNTLSEHRMHGPHTTARLAALLGSLLLLNACSQFPLGHDELSIFGEPAPRHEAADAPATEQPARIAPLLRPEALAQADTPEDRAAADEFSRIVTLLKGKHYTEAETALLDFIDRHPNASGAQLNLGMLYAGSERDELAEAHFRKAIEIRPDNALAYNQLGILYRHQRRLDEAEQAFLQAIKQQPDYALAHYNIGILYDIYLQKKDIALQHYQSYQSLTHGKDSLVKLWLADLDKQMVADNSPPAAAAQ